MYVTFFREFKDDIDELSFKMFVVFFEMVVFLESWKISDVMNRRLVNVRRGVGVGDSNWLLLVYLWCLKL